jgi:hypothetical protein
MRKSTPRRKIGSSGHVMIEAAFIFVVFFCMLIGAFDFGQFLFVHQALVERARMAARWGTACSTQTTCPTTDQITNLVLYGQSTNPGGGATGYFNLTSSMVTVSETTDTDCFASGAEPSLFTRLIVTIHDYPYVMLSPYSAGSYNGPNITIGEPINQDFSTPASLCP